MTSLKLPRHSVRFIALAVCVMAFIFGGITLDSSSSHEVMYGPQPPLKFCARDLCTYHYVLRVGNTGRYPQNNIDVSLARSWIDEAVIPLAIRNSGKVPRKYNKQVLKNDYLLSLGPLDPGKMVEISFSLQLDEGDSAPDWDEILLQVSPTTGTASRGDPQSMTFLRFIMRLFSFF